MWRRRHFGTAVFASDIYKTIITSMKGKKTPTQIIGRVILVPCCQQIPIKLVCYEILLSIQKNHRIHWPSCLSRPLDHTSSTFWRMTWAGRRSVWAPAEKNHSMGWDSVLSNEWALWLVESMDSFVNEEVSSNYIAQFVDMEICASNIGASRLSDWCEIWSRVSSALCRLPSRGWWWCQDTQHRCIGQAGAGSTWCPGLTRISRMFCI